MCLYPRLIPNPKYKANKKNGGNIPAVPDERVKLVPIGCQTCMECKRQKAKSWQARLTEDLKTHTNGKFVTLTFSHENYTKLLIEIQSKHKTPPTGYDLDNAIATRAVRLFLERWRKKYKKSVRHWLVTELGHEGTEGIHLHGIIWTDNLDDIPQIWGYGFAWIGNMKNGIRENYVNQKTVTYITKYVHKVDKDHKHYNSIVLTSAGIGNAFTQSADFKKHKYQGKQTREYYRTPSGAKISLPIYFRNKLYTETEREQLWLQRLDKQERFVLGNRICIKDGEEEYYKALKAAQELNKELGYKDLNKKTWEQEEYERERRKLKQKERVARAKKKNNKKKQ